jgi:hypothetical protein
MKNLNCENMKINYIYTLNCLSSINPYKKNSNFKLYITLSPFNIHITQTQHSLIHSSQPSHSRPAWNESGASSVLRMSASRPLKRPRNENTTATTNSNRGPHFSTTLQKNSQPVNDGFVHGVGGHTSGNGESPYDGGTPSLLKPSSSLSSFQSVSEPESPSEVVKDLSYSSSIHSSSLSSSSSSKNLSQPPLFRHSSSSVVKENYVEDPSVYEELAKLRQENDRLEKKLLTLCPKKKRLDTTLHTVSNKHNKVKKRALARQTSVATDAALNEIAMSAERHVTTNLLSEEILEHCGSTVGHKDFENIMRRPNFIREF